MFADIGLGSRVDIQKSRAVNAFDSLVGSSGEPLNWENEASPLAVKRFGLAKDNKIYSLDILKITKLKDPNFCKNLLSRLGTEDYYIEIYDSNAKLLECGSQLGGGISVTITRPVFIENTYGNMTIMVW